MARHRAQITTRDVEPAQATTIELASGIATDDIERPDLAVVTDETLDSPFVKEYLNDLKFNEDVLTVSISETTDPNAENPVPCACNGEVKLLERGKVYQLKRKFVDALIKCEDRVRTINYKDKDNVDQTRVERIPALKYPLAIHNDPAGDVGRRWFQHQCKNAW